MSRHLITLHTNPDRERAMHYVSKAPPGTRVEFKAAKRTLPQNDRMWAMLTDIAAQVPWGGKKRTPNQWKKLFLDELPREAEIVKSLSGGGTVNLTGSSDLSVEEMSDMIELIHAFGATHDVKFNEPTP